MKKNNQRARSTSIFTMIVTSEVFLVTIVGSLVGLILVKLFEFIF